MKNIRNFSIIAHIDHGKSTLADRMLEMTGTVERRKMKEQVLDSMELERERGITIKLAPVRIIHNPNRGELDRRNTQKGTQKYAESGTTTPAQNNAENKKEDGFLYKDTTYKIRGALFAVRKAVGLGHKEQVYHNALEIEFKKAGLAFESKKNISIQYDEKQIGTYQPDFVVEDKILIELKALPEIGKPQAEQLWSYLKGCEYKIALLVNFGSRDLEIRRIVYDTARRHASEPKEDSANSASSLRPSAGVSDQVEDEFVLNLIDTPGHIDFSYEVSRALKAVEGAILLVDATQGIQAQTLTTLRMAEELGLVIIPALSKVDAPLARVHEVALEISELLDCPPESVLHTSGKTGEGVRELLDAVIERIPPPPSAAGDIPDAASFRSLVFDFGYSTHKGIIVYVRVFDGSVSKGDSITLHAANQSFAALEVGVFVPEEKPVPALSAGEIGYIVTGIKKPGIASVGDTIAKKGSALPALPGYRQPAPVVWASIYPESQDDFTLLLSACERLRLSDSSFSYTQESSGPLGRGLRCGFLGMLHLEIVTERLRREFTLDLIVTSPSIVYAVTYPDRSEELIYTPSQFPDHGRAANIREPWVSLRIITPPEYINALMPLLYEHEAVSKNSETFGDGRMALSVEMPLRELMRGFFDRVKTASSGYASLSYELADMRDADVVRLDVLVAEERVAPFSRVVARKRVEEEAENAVTRLHGILPRQLFATKIQGAALGRIISSKTLPALKKDVTGHLYGGDITRKRKLWEKQKKGKKRLKTHGTVNIPHEVFMKMIKVG